MTFEHEKQQMLSKQDKSAKGSIDAPMQPLVDAINAHPHYYTSSCCSGRVVLIDRKETKKSSQWKFVSHATISESDLKRESLADHWWFLVESPIIHISCASIDAAKDLLRKARETGWGKCGILNIRQDKVSVELCGNERMEMPASCITDATSVQLTELANQKVKKGHELISQLVKKLRS